MLTTLKKREITPTNYRYAAVEDPKGLFEKAFADFLGECASFEEASKLHIYDAKEEVLQNSFRVHCAWLAQLITSAQDLIFSNDKLILEHPELEYQFKLLQQKTDEFIARLYDWHGVPGTHSSEPATFKQAMNEVDAGEVEDFTL